MVFANPVVHPADAERRRERRVLFENDFERVPAFGLVGHARRRPAGDDADPVLPAFYVLDLQTNLRIVRDDLGFLAFGRVNVNVGVVKRVMEPSGGSVKPA